MSPSCTTSALKRPPYPTEPHPPPSPGATGHGAPHTTSHSTGHNGPTSSATCWRRGTSSSGNPTRNEQRVAVRQSVSIQSAAEGDKRRFCGLPFVLPSDNIPRQPARATPTPTPIGHLREREDRPENQETPPQPVEDQQSRHSVTNAVRVVITESRVSTAERRRRKDTDVTLRHDRAREHVEMSEAPGGEGKGEWKGKGKRPHQADHYSQEPPSPALNQPTQQQQNRQYPSYQPPPPPPRPPSQHSQSSTLQSPLQSPSPLPFPLSSSLPNLSALASKPAPVPERAQTNPTQLPTGLASASPTRTTTRLPTPASPLPLPPRPLTQPTRSKTAPSVPGDVSCFRHTHQSNEPFRDGKATEAAASEQEQQQQPSTSVASASSSSTHPSSLYVYTPVSESAVSTSSYVTAATGLEDLPPNDPTFARHVANNDPERETMLSGDHINSGQDSAGLSVDSDADSAMGDITGALSTSSLRSSIYNYIEEHGRTFHRYKQGNLQHAVFMRMLKGKFGLAPVTNPQSVLDIGTGTGIWAIEFAIQNPAAHVVGTDLSPIQPEYVPPNCHFEIDDAEDEWIFSQQFDYVHVRLLFHAFNSHKEVMMSAFRQLNPGGWMEWQDYYPHIQSVDGSIAGTALERWSRMYIEGGQRLGRDMLAPRRYKQWMEEAGFINVVEEKLVIPGNPWPKGKEQKVTGVWQMTNFLEGLHAVSMTIFTKGLGMSPEEVEVFLVDVRKDIRNLRIHFYFLTNHRYPTTHDQSGHHGRRLHKQRDDARLHSNSRRVEHGWGI
ncbi:S-adenosyl-L-methionine-dependent methyltransferase [Neurospora hispaniola]|uniref:S-adenosyl-L-methionine-dependent methyltransferase n=1 Tax=Neurospora hispaniola TaxID=588809 RepID=A0AAJ0I749_9PEZI|nr:S-adenosyl-L-methionine-dependent methyltransferase [Neurospora hispaniola]